MPYVNQISPGVWEAVDRVQLDPRPAGHEGIYGDGSSTFHWIGKQSGHLSTEKTYIGGYVDWFTPQGEKLGYEEIPQFKQVSSIEEFENDPDVYIIGNVIV